MKRHMAVVAFLLLALAFAVCAAPADPGTAETKIAKKAAKLMARFHKAVQEKKADEAIDLIRQVIVMEPEYAVAHHNLGVMLLQKDQVDEAIASFEKALQLQPGYAHAQNALRQSLFEAGKAALDEKKFGQSNEYLLKLLAMPSPGKENESMLAYARFYVGNNFFNLKQFPQARENFASCRSMTGMEAEHAELFANSLYFLGLIEYENKDYLAASSNFKEYVKLVDAAEKKPQLYPIANYFVGDCLFRRLEADMKQGQTQGMDAAVAEIIPYLERAIAHGFPGEDAHVLLGNSYVYTKNYDKAVETYEAMIAAFPQSPQLENYRRFLTELRKNRPQGKKK